MVINGEYNPSCQNNMNETNAPSKEHGVAVLICRPNSHPFAQRELALDQVVKIGRSVARTRPAVNNGIFDCKVLSRNHALFSYSHGKFFLRDTKSSNGTFVNDHRLSKSGEESPWQEVCSGDIVQFGVDVQENAKNSKITHGSIIADLKLYLPDGKEAKGRSSTTNSGCFDEVSLHDLFLLYEYIQDSLLREVALEQKLADLQKLLGTIKQSVDVNWKARISEDRLLSKIETLESQLQAYSRNFSDDKLREEFVKAQDHKNKCEENSKQLVEKFLKEKIEADTKCENLERTLAKTESECYNFEIMLAKCREELTELARAHSSKVEELQSQIMNCEMEKDVLNSDLEKKKESLQMTRLKLENTHLELLNVKIKCGPGLPEYCLKELQSKNQSAPNIMPYNRENGLSKATEKIDDKETNLKMISEQIKEKIDSASEERSQNEEILEQINAKLKELNTEKMSKLERINELESEIDSHIKNLGMYQSVRDTMLQKIDEIKKTLKLKYFKLDSTSKSCEIIDEIINDTINNDQEEEKKELEKELENFKGLLADALSKIENTEEEIENKKVQLDYAKDSLLKTTEEILNQNQNMQNCLHQVQQQEQIIGLFKSHLESLYSDQDLVSNPLDLKIFQSEMENLENDAALASALESIYSVRCVSVKAKKKALADAQQVIKQSKNENEILKDCVSRLEEDMEIYLKNQNDLTKALSISKQKCENLSNSVNTLEQQLFLKRSESAQERVTPQNASKDIELTKKIDQATETEFVDCSLPVVESDSKTASSNLQVTENFKSKLLELESELVTLREKFRTSNESKMLLETELSNLRQNYHAMMDQPLFTTVFMLPLIILVFACVFTWYPKLSFILGTADTPASKSNFEDQSNV